jgi:uncharacterized protein involved in outer membrane biogenesis
MRKLGIIVVVVLVIMVVLAAIVPHFIDVNRYRGQIQAQLEQRLNRPVSLGQMHASLFPPSAKVENAVIGEDRSFHTGRPFASARMLTVSLRLLPLLHGDFEVSSIELKQPQVELVRNPQGAWNVASLGKNTSSGPATPAPQTTPSQPGQNPSSQQSFSLGELKLTDGTVAVTDEQQREPRAVYDHIDLSLANFAPGRPFSIALAAHLPGQGAQVARLQGTGGPIDQANMINTPFDGNIKLDEVSLSGVQKFLNSSALADTNATITGTATVKNQSGKVTSKGDLKIDNAVVNGNDIGYPIAVNYDATDDLANDLIDIGHADIKLGATPLSVAGTLNGKNTPALIDAKLNAANVSIAEIARLAASFGYAFNPNMRAAGQISADIHAQGSTQTPVLNGTVSARNLVISGKDLPQPVKVPEIQLALSPNTIQSGNFMASTAGTNVTGRFALAQYATKSPVLNATLQIPETQLSDVLNIARSFGVSAVDGVSGNGQFALNLTANGPIKNTSAMTFSGNGSVRNASIRSPQFTQPLNIQNVALTFSRNGVALNNFAGAIGSTHANGQISVKNFSAPQIALALNADKIDVAEWQKLIAPSLQPAPDSQPARQQTAAQQQVRRNRPAQTEPQQPARQNAQATQPTLLDKATGGGPLNIGTLTYDQLQFNNVRSTLALDHGIIRLAPVTATVASGQSTGNIMLDTRGPQTQIAVNMAVQKVDANKLLSSVSNVKDTLYGLLASSLQGQLHTVGPGQNIASTLNGKVSLDLANGKLAHVDFLQQLSQVAGFQNLGQAAAGATELKKLTGDFNIRNGLADTNNLQADLGVGTLAANGVMSLVDNSVNMKVTAVLNKAFSRQVGGTNVGGFMRTALANNRGELVLPVLVTGTLQNPKIAPDLETIAQMKMKNLLPTLNNPGAVGGILSGIMGGKSRQRGGQNQSPLGGILGALGGRNNQQQPAQGNQPDNSQAQQQQQQQQQPPSDIESITNAIGGLFGKKKKQQQPPPQQPPPPPPER